MKLKRLLVPILLGIMGSANAQVQTIFHCNTKNNKQIFLGFEPNTNTVTYAFGKDLNHPEMMLQRNIQQVRGESHYSSAEGATINVVDIPNGNALYSVQELYTQNTTEVGVEVTQKGKRITFVSCKNNKPNISNLESFASELSQ